MKYNFEIIIWGETLVFENSFWWKSDYKIRIEIFSHCDSALLLRANSEREHRYKVFFSIFMLLYSLGTYSALKLEKVKVLMIFVGWFHEKQKHWFIDFKANRTLCLVKLHFFTDFRNHCRAGSLFWGRFMNVVSTKLV